MESDDDESKTVNELVTSESLQLASSKVDPTVNPFATLLENSKDKVRVKYKTYVINRLDADRNNFESSIIWSLFSSYPQRFTKVFSARGIDRSIIFFRELVKAAALSDMLYPKDFYEQDCSLNLDALSDSMMLDIVDAQSIPKDIGDRLRNYEDQFSKRYSSNLETFLKKNITADVLWDFWSTTVDSESLCGNNFFQLSSKLLEIGIAGWTPDPATPGDYIISCCFGCKFKDTIHIISHSHSLEVTTTEIKTR